MRRDSRESLLSMALTRVASFMAPSNVVSQPHAPVIEDIEKEYDSSNTVGFVRLGFLDRRCRCRNPSAIAKAILAHSTRRKEPDISLRSRVGMVSDRRDQNVLSRRATHSRVE